MFVRTATNYAVIMISIDRFQSIFKPIPYHNDTSILKPRYLISFSWIISIVTGYSNVLWISDQKVCNFYHSTHPNQLVIFGILGKSFPCLVLILIYGSILLKIKVIFRLRILMRDHFIIYFLKEND